MRAVSLLILSLIITACAGASEPVDLPTEDGQPYDDEPAVDGGYASAVQDSGSAPATQDAGTQQSDGGPAVVDASVPKVDASIAVPDAALVHRDAGSVPDANVPTDAGTPQDASATDAGVVVVPDAATAPTAYLRRACSTSADCRDPFVVYENGSFATIALPRPGYDSPGEQPICVVKAGAATGRCSFYCKLNDPTGASLGSWFPDQNRWCKGFNAQCLDVGTGTACLLAGQQ